MTTPERPQQIPLELSEEERSQVSLARAVSDIALETGQFIVIRKWPEVLELRCVPYSGREVIPPYPPEAFPEFKAVRQSDRVYDVSTRMPFMAGHSSRRMVGATCVKFQAEAPPLNEWGWRLSRFAIHQLFWCEPERTPVPSNHAASKALEYLALTVTKLRRREELIPNWPAFWLTPPPQT